ncbi:MAG: exopolyphosphatase, partial [Pseudomonadota bacterium]
MFLAKKDAPGRLSGLAPVAIVDIGSNSVRLVAYEGLSRSPTPIFNDKVLCGLGRGVAITGRLPQDGVERALAALRRYRVLCDAMEITDISVMATAAARDAVNGPEFLAAASEALRAHIDLLPGRREAELSALGVVSGFWRPDGVAGDLGGGSLELNEVKGDKLGLGITLQLGGLALMDMSDRSPKRAQKIARDMLADAKPLKKLAGRTFYAIGGTWRA